MVEDVRAVVDHASQSEYSDPGNCAVLFDDIKPTIDDVSAMARNVVAHYRARAAELPDHSKDDIDLRWVSAILDTDQARHGTPLTTERALADRVQGCCRDHTLLSVAALRHHGVPARSRVGFASYLSADDWNHDHVIVEAWMDGRWRRFDPEFASPLPALADPTDIAAGPDSPFRTAADVWLGHRAGRLDVTRFGVAEGMAIGGDWFVFGYVIGQVAHRFGDELLLWDQWGGMSGDLQTAPPENLALVDEVARLLARVDDGDLGAEQALLDRYHEDERLHPGSQIRTFSPNGGASIVDLTAKTSRPM
jgi:hypothetical protein